MDTVSKLAVRVGNALLTMAPLLTFVRSFEPDKQCLDRAFANILSRSGRFHFSESFQNLCSRTTNAKHFTLLAIAQTGIPAIVKLVL